MTIEHKSVLAAESIQYLGVAKEKKGVWVDATAGFGGHSRRILENMSDEAVLLSIDRDLRAIEKAEERLSEFSGVKFIHSEFSGIDRILRENGIKEILGIIYDFGVSSLHLESPARGFSFLFDAPLDMRMDEGAEFTAYDVVNGYNRADLERVVRDYGEEWQYERIVSAIMKHRPVKTTGKLAEIVAAAKKGREKIHPATKVFQGIRIEVNDELGEIKKSLKGVLPYLAANARICAISFHSLEDRIVKEFFRENAEKKGGVLRILTKKPVVPGKDEVRFNPRSRSAKLRAAEKVEQAV
ncbi:MAG TPA: 16S rRNA (cytosine(1402)-N(4))-methyltransferase RsmH [Firmicutes bacterium]|nr:16S rRNA (cytosine(1402)-N(4))-methyltransferase RsmH [Bacillota bacterium]